MQHEFWHDAWESGDTGWQQDEPNEFLRQYWPELQIPAGATVLVPLCGDSVDMQWLADQQLRVCGVELNRGAVDSFFERRGLQPDVIGLENGVFCQLGSFSIFCGDILEVSDSLFPEIHAVYDRGATVALPTDVREQYAARLSRLVPADTQMLLVSLSYDEESMDGPPFSVPYEEVQRLYGGGFKIQRIGPEEPTEIPPPLAERGVTGMEESIYHLRRLADG